MINEEVLGGLKSALERGQSLQKAMMTLYNSGYKKEEIEEAARSLMEFSSESQLQPPVKTVPKTAEIRQAPQVLTTPITVKSFPELQPYPRPIPQPIQQQQPLVAQRLELQRLRQQVQRQPMQIPVIKPLPVQKVSSYEQPQLKQKIKEKGKSREKAIIFILVFLLVLLIGVLGGIFLFKQQLIDFFSTFFG